MTSPAMEAGHGQQSDSQEAWSVQSIDTRNRECEVCESAGRRCSHHKPLSWSDASNALSERGGGRDAVTSLERAISAPGGKNLKLDK